MPTIRIDDEVFAVLQKRAQAFVDSPNDVLRRDYGLNGFSANEPIHDVPGAPSFAGGEPQSIPTRRRRKVMGRILRGEKTPEPEYVTPILQALVQAGGIDSSPNKISRLEDAVLLTELAAGSFLRIGSSLLVGGADRQ